MFNRVKAGTSGLATSATFNSLFVSFYFYIFLNYLILVSEKDFSGCYRSDHKVLTVIVSADNGDFYTVGGESVLPRGGDCHYENID